MAKISFILNKIRKKLFGFKSIESRINYLRSQGLKIGEGCLYFSNKIPPEPYLVEIGNHVVISSDTEFITHDGSVWVFRKKNPKLDVFGMTTVGNNTFIGIGCIFLPNTKIGENCIIGAGSVVRGVIPDNSVVMGNPAKVIMSTELMEKLSLNNKNALQTKHLNMAEKAVIIKKHFNID
ncbi:MAG: acyltransferase [Deltaproteobacteria bacterium]|nr:MAG: acyltransferase [Deltaproteobacteria bacterium]